MMLIRKDSVDIDEYVKDGRLFAETQLELRLGMMASIQSTLRTLNGIEIAARMGVDAAWARTVGAQSARSGARTKESK